MSSRFFIQEGVSNQIRVTSAHIPELEDEWILIKEKLSTKDMAELQTRLFNIEAPNLSRSERRRRQKTGEATSKVTMNAQTPIFLSLAILDWSFVDDVGVKVPVNEDYINMLLPTISDQLYELIDANNPL